MANLWIYLRNSLLGAQEIPEEYRENFKHYYLDISWWGLLNGSTISFLNYFAVHVGANATQIGLITAAPAIICLLFALPAGVYLGKRSNTREAFRFSVFTRIFYLVFILLPFFQSASFKIWAIIIVTLVMNIPGIFTQLSFNIAFAENIPDQYRAHVSGLRNAAFAVITTGITLFCGFILRYISFPYGYTVVFAIGFLGAVMSSVELYQIKPVNEFIRYDIINTKSDEKKEPKIGSVILEGLQSFKTQIRFDLLKGKTGRILILLCLLNLSIYISTPVFPVYFVEQYHFSDQTISIGMAIYYAMMFVGSLGLERIDKKMGHQKVTSIGMIFVALFPLAILLSKNPLFYFIGNMATGFGWALTGGDIYNYLYERIPEKDHSLGVTWYNLGANATILLGSLIGPVLSQHYSLVACLLIFFFARLTIGFAILRWG